MKKNIFTRVLFGVFIFTFMFFGFTASADHCGKSDPDDCVHEIGGNSIKLKNPLENGGVSDIPTLVEKILDIALTIGVPIIALAIIYAGFKFISAQGNPEKLKEAKQTIIYVFIGAAILLAAYAIATAVVDTISAIRG